VRGEQRSENLVNASRRLRRTIADLVPVGHLADQAEVEVTMSEDDTAAPDAPGKSARALVLEHLGCTNTTAPRMPCGKQFPLFVVPHKDRPMW